MTEEQRRVLIAANKWRYALVTPDADVHSAQDELVEAVDQLDIEQAYGE